MLNTRICATCQVLEDNLRERGVLGDLEQRPPLLEFALLLMDTYVRYPTDNFDQAWFPINYCILPYAVSMSPAVRSIVERLLSWMC